MKIISMLAIFSVCYGCKKNIVTEINGIVKNKITGQGIPNIPLTIYSCNGFPNKCLDSLKTIYTDVAGNYSTFFDWESWTGGRKIQVEPNDDYFISDYNYNYLERGKSNNVNFFLFSKDVLNAKVKVRLHNKNWLSIFVQSRDTLNFFSTIFYNGVNPITDFDSTFNSKFPVGREYLLTAILANKDSTTTLKDVDFYHKPFFANISDTTFVDFIVQ